MGKMTQKKGGNLCAPIIKGSIGECGFLNNHSRERLEQTLQEYKQICAKYPRGGLGIDVHCVEVGLEEASTTGLTKQEKQALAQQQAQSSSMVDCPCAEGGTLLGVATGTGCSA